jgi:hypothetical protein
VDVALRPVLAAFKMTVPDNAVQDNTTNALRSKILSLGNDQSETCKAKRVETSRMFCSMSELFDTALIRTPGLVDQLAKPRGASIIHFCAVEKDWDRSSYIAKEHMQRRNRACLRM